MPTNNSEKTSHPNLGALLEGLLRAKVDFILVGGLAAVVQGAPITTIDVDIVHDRSLENIGKLLSYLSSIDAFHRRPDEKIILPAKYDIMGDGHTLLSTCFGPLDVLSVIEEGKTYEQLIEHTVNIPFRGHTLKVLDLETMIQLKKILTSPQRQTPPSDFRRDTETTSGKDVKFGPFDCSGTSGKRPVIIIQNGRPRKLTTHNSVCWKIIECSEKQSLVGFWKKLCGIFR